MKIFYLAFYTGIARPGLSDHQYRCTGSRLVTAKMPTQFNAGNRRSFLRPESYMKEQEGKSSKNSENNEEKT